ncbi:MAG: ATP-grasp domain-containing protein [Candidatus Sumerlaeia bacterium]|nr:ATP-grasp domain-containing protein [Candidatus Sumerlaeia bacterium]
MSFTDQLPAVLVTDGLWRKTLAAVRSLGRKGVPVVVGERTRLAPALWSRYATRRYLYPSARLKTEAFLARLQEIITRENVRVLMPMEEETLLTVLRARARFGKGIAIPFAEPEKIERVRDKAQLFRLAESLALPMPRTWYPESPDDVALIGREAEFPLIIKPRVSTGAVGLRRAGDAAALLAAWAEIHARFPQPIIQEYIPEGGGAFGASVLVGPQGERLASFVHRRVREYPVSGGASTFRVSAHDPQLVEIVFRLLEAVGWSGVAMAEFRYDPRDGQPKLIEVNPRFWGALNLAVQSGVDFPWLLYRMALGERIEPVHSYREGVVGRWVLHGDLMHYLTNPRRRQMQPSFWKFRGPDWHYDITTWDDPLPTVGTIFSLLLLLYDKEIRGFLKR